MAKTTNLCVKIEPNLKEQAEEILNMLGIPSSTAITMFYKQIVLNNGLPFSAKLPPHPLDINLMSDSDIKSKIKKGISEMKENKCLKAEDVFNDLHKEFNI